MTFLLGSSLTLTTSNDYANCIQKVIKVHRVGIFIFKNPCNIKSASKSRIV